MAEQREIFVHTRIDVDEEEFLRLRRLFERMEEELVFLQEDKTDLEQQMVGAAMNENWTRIAELSSQLESVRLEMDSLKTWIRIGKGEDD